MLVIVLSVSLLTACGGSGGKGETITLTVYSQLANYNGEMTGWFAQIMLERFNVRIILIDDQDGVYDTRMEAGDLGDIVVWGNNGDDYARAARQGLLWDWDDEDLLREYGPYIYENMPAALQSNRDISMREIGEPKLFGFGHNVASSAEDMGTFFYTWDLRWDIYRDIGYPSMRNLDEFIDVLDAMRNHVKVDNLGNPVYAASLWTNWDGTMVMYVKSMATAYYGYDELHMGLYDSNTGTYYDALMEGGPYLEMLEFFNKLYRRGLLDPDSMTHTFDTMSPKLQNGGTLFSIFNFSGSEGYNTLDHMNEDKIMLSYAPTEATPIAYGLNVYGGNRVWTIGARTQHPELCMEILNWLATPEGRLTVDYGPKGVTWDYDEDGNTVFTELGKRTDADRNTEMEGDYSGKFGDGSFQINNTTWDNMVVNPESNEPYNKAFWRSYQQEPRNAAEADWREFTGATSIHEFMVNRPHTVSPGIPWNDATRSVELRSTWEQVTTEIVNSSWRAIYADTPEEFNDIVATMIANARAYGYDECVDFSLEEAARRWGMEQDVRAAAAGN